MILNKSKNSEKILITKRNFFLNLRQVLLGKNFLLITLRIGKISVKKPELDSVYTQFSKY